MIESLQYVVSAPNFLMSIGFMVAAAMFVGGIVHNGDLRSLNKGVITLLIYLIILFFATQSRVVDSIARGEGVPKLGYAGLITLVITSIAYISGLFWGVLVIKFTTKRLNK